MQMSCKLSVRFVYIVIFYYIKPHGSYNSKIQVVAIIFNSVTDSNLGAVQVYSFLKLSFQSELRGKLLAM